MKILVKKPMRLANKDSLAIQSLPRSNGRFVRGNVYNPVGNVASLSTKESLLRLKKLIVDTFVNEESDNHVLKIIKEVRADKPERLLGLLEKFMPTELIVDADVRQHAPIVIPELLRKSEESSN